jgi:TRAP-type C4-dicarboxylate transport system substrate-binding protein
VVGSDDAGHEVSAAATMWAPAALDILDDMSTTTPSDWATTADQAAADAAAAAAESGVRVVQLSDPAEFRRAAAVLQEIWRSSQGEPMSAETLVALDFSGN